MDPRIEEQIAKIDELSDEELASLEKDLSKQFDDLDKEKPTPTNVQEMEKVADALDTVRVQQDTRETAAADSQRKAEELRSRVHPVDEGETEEPETPAEAEPEAGEASPEVEEEEESEVPEAIAASGRRAPARTAPLGTLTRRAASPTRPAALATTSRTLSMSNSTNAGKMVGDEFSNFEEVVLAMTERINSLGRGTGENFTVARVNVDYPEERKLKNNDALFNTKVFDDTSSTRALTAAGGICSPVDVDYSILTVASDAEPLAGDLPSYQAARGGLRFVTPPALWTIGSAGTTVWTEAVDAAAAYPNADGTLPAEANGVKPVQRFVCGVENEIFVDAIPTRLQFGNMMARFSPEIVAANTELALANAARYRELHRLTQIASYSTSVSSGQLLGAARDLLATMDQIAAAFRYRQRIPRAGGPQMRVIMPEWAIDLVRADLTRELAHGDMDSNLALTDAQVETLLASRGFAVTWMLDAMGAGHSGNANAGLNYVDQSWGTYGNSNYPQAQGGIIGWPTQLVWYMFVEGTFQRLDGGTLDLGVVRDPTYNSVNVYETFVEIFESIAFRGTEALQVVSQVRPNGASAAGVITATSPNVY